MLICTVGICDGNRCGRSGRKIEVLNEGKLLLLCVVEEKTEGEMKGVFTEMERRRELYVVAGNCRSRKLMVDSINSGDGAGYVEAG